MDKVNIIKKAAEELLNKGNIAIIEEVFSLDYVAFAENKEFKGLAFIQKYSKQLRTTFPDLKVVKVDFLAVNNNVITWQRTLEGTHKKVMKGIPASNKKLSWNEMVVSVLAEDKITKEWIVSELMGQMLLHTKK